MAERKGKGKKPLNRRPSRKKKPKFNVPNYGFMKSVKSRWRKPRGTHNKKRMKKRFMGASPKIGYKNPKKDRGLHSSGAREVLVRNMSELEALKGAFVAVRMASALGARKKKLMEEKAKALNLVVLNLRNNGKSAQPKG